jgi:hypothetical protein
VVSSSGTISALGCRIPAQDSGTRVAAKIVLGSDEKGFLDFLAWTEDQRYDSDSPPKKEKKIKRKKGKREVKNLECSINFDARGVGSSRVRGKKLGV